jgi:CTP synthase
MQVAVIEFARNVAGMSKAHSTEFDPKSPFPVIDLMPDQHDVVNKGGTMRLGRFPCSLKVGSKALALYKDSMIYERHRHRYEVNNKFRDDLKTHGLVFSGVSPDDRLVEMIELSDHPYFVACQFHPELKSRPDNPHPLFVGFVEASMKNSDKEAAGEKRSKDKDGKPSTIVSSPEQARINS